MWLPPKFLFSILKVLVKMVMFTFTFPKHHGYYKTKRQTHTLLLLFLSFSDLFAKESQFSVWMSHTHFKEQPGSPGLIFSRKFGVRHIDLSVSKPLTPRMESKDGHTHVTSLLKCDIYWLLKIYETWTCETKITNYRLVCVCTYTHACVHTHRRWKGLFLK